MEQEGKAVEQQDEVMLESRIVKTSGYHDGQEVIPVYVNDKRKDVFLSRLKPVGDRVIIRYEGPPKDVKDSLLDSLLVVSDTSYNPMRPFRWYKRVYAFADTNSPESIIETRQKSFSAYLEDIGSPDCIWIYEIV